jgi:hypothetical protein
VSAPPKWQVTGTRYGKPKVVCVKAPDYQAAVRAASFAPHMLVVHGAVMVDDRREQTRAKAVEAFKALTKVQA